MKLHQIRELFKKATSEAPAQGRDLVYTHTFTLHDKTTVEAKSFLTKPGVWAITARKDVRKWHSEQQEAWLQTIIERIPGKSYEGWGLTVKHVRTQFHTDEGKAVATFTVKPGHHRWDAMEVTVEMHEAHALFVLPVPANISGSL